MTCAWFYYSKKQIDWITENPSLVYLQITAAKVNKAGTWSEEDDAEISAEDEEPGGMSWHCLVSSCLCLSLKCTHKPIYTDINE